VLDALNIFMFFAGLEILQALLSEGLVSGSFI
jgi:hypothetical protein